MLWLLVLVVCMKLRCGVSRHGVEIALSSIDPGCQVLQRKLRVFLIQDLM